MSVYDEIDEYCKANDIEDIPKFIEYLLSKAFSIEKYGNHPSVIKSSKKTIKTTKKEVKEKEIQKPSEDNDKKEVNQNNTVEEAVVRKRRKKSGVIILKSEE